MKGDWQQVFSGRQFWPLDPQPEDLDIRDIAHALSLQCRFGGHTRHHYSVAQHSILVMELRWCCTPRKEEEIDPRENLAALLHDASEAYLVDIPQPVKPHLGGYKEAEERLMAEIASRWDFPSPPPTWVKTADAMALAIEKQAFFGHEPAPWKEMPEPPARLLSMVSQQPSNMQLVESQFLERHYRLCGQTGVKP